MFWNLPSRGLAVMRRPLVVWRTSSAQSSWEWNHLMQSSGGLFLQGPQMSPGAQVHSPNEACRAAGQPVAPDLEAQGTPGIPLPTVPSPWPLFQSAVLR